MALAGLVPAVVANPAEKALGTMWLDWLRALAWSLALLGGSSAGVLAFAPRPKGPG
jgi:hypothetical protein